MTRIVGLTGSIGMGKTTTANMFRALDVPVHDADQAVHALYNEAQTIAAIEDEFPGVSTDGAINRTKLSGHVVDNAEAMKRLEAIVHPRVREHERQAIDAARAMRAPYIILDIPLLFETDGAKRCDAVIVVTAPPDVQRERVLARKTMTEDKFAAILSRQIPDHEKRARADFIVDTSRGMDSARNQVRAIDERLRNM